MLERINAFSFEYSLQETETLFHVLSVTCAETAVSARDFI